MPLKKSPSRSAFVSNLKTELKAGKPRDQALAIAYAVKRRARAAGGEVSFEDRWNGEPYRETADDVAARARNLLHSQSGRLAEPEAPQEAAYDPMSGARIGADLDRTAPEAAPNRYARATIQAVANMPKAMLWDSPRDLVDAARESPFVPGQPPSDDLVGQTFMTSIGLAGTAAPMAMRGAAGIFGGRLAQTADHAKLARAEEMHAAGADPRLIWNETGWFQGADGQWRFEIPDADSGFFRKRTPTTIDNYDIVNPRTVKAGAAYNHPGLYAAYPDLADVDLRFAPLKDINGYYRRPGAETPGDLIPPPGEEIGLNTPPDRYGKNMQQVRSTALHELQHAVQQREGFAPGSSPEAMLTLTQVGEDARLLSQLGSGFEFKKATGRDPHPAARTLVAQMTPEELALIERDPYNAYRRVAGEVEARNVQTRRDFGDTALTKPPWATEDIPRDQQLIGPSHDPAAPALDIGRATKNPSPRAIDSLLKGSEQGHLRGLIDESGAYVWDANKGTHHDAAKELGLDYNIENRFHLTPEGDGYARLDIGSEWTPDRVLANPHLVRMLSSDKILIENGSQGLITGPEYLNEIRGALHEQGKSAAAPERAAAADPAAVGSGGGGQGGVASLPEAQATAARWAGERKPLEGLPGALKIGDEHFVPGPIGKIHDVAEEYMRTAHPDRPYTPPTKYHPLDPEHSKAIAQAYEEMAHTPNDPATKASYDALIKETADQYQAIKKTGLKIEPILPGMEDPYAANPRLAARDVAENNHLWFFPTDQGFGSGEFIKSSAVRHPNGKIYEGPIHSDAYEAAAADTGMSFDRVIGQAKPKDVGFVTSTGRFVTREEAAKIARESKQAPHAQDELSSEYLPEGYERGPLSDNPMLRKTGEKIGDHELLANDMFRIVHDYFGHLKEGHGFRAAGEDNAWRTHSAMYSDIARPAMTTETRGQNSWVNYGPHGEKNRKANAAETTYADQKVGLMPEWVMRDRGSAAPIMMYHGTPHSFDRFDFSKIGAGEGNQAYGHGLYFAGHEPVSEWYRHQLATRQDPLLEKYGLQEVGHVIGSHLSDVGGKADQLVPKYIAERDKLIASGDDSKATTNMIKEYDRRIQYLQDPQRATGHLYQVGAEVNPDHLLDYDAMFASQTPHVQGRVGPVMEQSVKEQIEAIDRLLAKGGTGTPGTRSFRPYTQHKINDLEGRRLILEQHGPRAFKGNEIYQRTGLPAKDPSEASVNASQRLRAMGIPGLQYLDGSSRAGGQGTRNFVMFGDDMLKILRKYGVVGIPAAGVLSADGEERRARGGKVERALRAARAEGGSVFDWSGVGEAMPEHIGRDKIMDPIVNAATLPKRAMDASQRMVETGEYDAAPFVEAALLPMGTGAMAGVRALPREAVFGSGPVRRLVDDTGSAATPTRPSRIYAEPEFTESGSMIINKGVDNPPNRKIQTVADPHRMMYPGIYRNPRVIAEEAAARVGEEDPAMQRLFGVTRGDLREMAQGRVGNEEPKLWLSERPRGALSAQNIQTPQNTQRLVDILGEAGRHEGLRTADAWYIMDPVYRRMVELFGPEEAAVRYRKLNTLTGMASPGSDVMTEIQRGTGAHWLSEQGRFGDFQKYAGVPEAMRSSQRFPNDLRYIGGHPYHRTSQSDPMAKYLEAGEIQSKNPKVPLYVHASGVPETGFQTSGPVGDAHFSRGVGLSDTRKGPSDVQGSFSTSEYQTLQPWWQHEVAGEVGLESVPAQARLWTALGPQTGVESALGAPKLELLSKQIMEAAKRLRVSPETARDMILSGKAGAGVLATGLLGPEVIGMMREQHAAGGAVSNALQLARSIKRANGGAVHTGAIMGDTDGRADEVPMEVPDGAYVLTADHVSSMGEGNTLSGFKKLDQMFPKSAAGRAARKTVKRARGGGVPIYAADGEYVICPEDITDRWGDLEAGHRYLDAWQTSSRKEHVNTLRNLAPPAQD